MCENRSRQADFSHSFRRGVGIPTNNRHSPDQPDSHPNRLANETIGPLFVEFIDGAGRTYRSSRSDSP